MTHNKISLKEGFEALYPLLEEELPKKTRWDKESMQKVMETMGFQLWKHPSEKVGGFSRDVPLIWTHPEGMYAISYRSKIRLTALTACPSNDWLSDYTDEIIPLVTEHGIRAHGLSFSICGFDDLENLYNDREKLQYSLPIKYWSPIIFNQITTELRNYISMSDNAYQEFFKNYLSSSHEMFKEHSQNYSSFMSKYKKFEDAESKEIFIDKIISSIIYNYFPEGPNNLENMEVFSFLSGYLHGRGIVSWQQVEDSFKDNSSIPHPLFLCMRLNAKVSMMQTEYVSDFKEKILDEEIQKICETLSSSEMKNVWEKNQQGKHCFFFFLFNSLYGIFEMEKMFSKTKKASNLLFLNENFFNFKGLFENEEEYKKEMKGLYNSIPFDYKIEKALSSLFENIPELLTKNNLKELESFVADIPDFGVSFNMHSSSKVIKKVFLGLLNEIKLKDTLAHRVIPNKTLRF